MKDSPNTHFRKSRRKGKRAGAKVETDFRAQYSHDHLYYKIKGSYPGEQSENKQQATDYFTRCNKMSRLSGKGETQFCEPAHSLVRICKFQKPFPEKDAACQQAND